MRSLLLLLCVATACAGRETAWQTLPAPELPEGGEAFILVDSTAVHLKNVEHDDDHVHGRIVHAWALPPVGVAALADDTRTTSPEDIARKAGWVELPLVNARVDIPDYTIRSARGVVDVEPDDED